MGIIESVREKPYIALLKISMISFFNVMKFYSINNPVYACCQPWYAFFPDLSQ